MHYIKKKILPVFIIIILVLISILSPAQIQKDIISCMQKGNSKQLSEFFNVTVEMAVLENNNVYSKAQARQIISKFFSDNTPVNFSVLSDEMKKEARNIIGTLKTSNSTFRVYILLKKGEDKKDYIHLIKIEKR